MKKVWSKGLTKYNHPSIEKISQSKIGKKNPNWKGGVDNSEYLQRIVYKKNDKLKMCEHCKSKKYIQLHHKDKNQKNNIISNIKILCASCHRKEHYKNIWASYGIKKCRCCGTTKRKHEARGLCINCYVRLRYQNKNKKYSRLYK